MTINNSDFYIDLDLNFKTTEVSDFSVEIFTTNINNAVKIDKVITDGEKEKVLVEFENLKKLESGVIAYIYSYYINDENAEDRQFNRSEVNYTDYYYQNTLESGKQNQDWNKIVSELANDANYISSLPPSLHTKGVPILNQMENNTLIANTFYNFGEVENLTIVKLKEDEMSEFTSEFIFQFECGNTPTVLSLPESIKFQSELELKSNHIYQISIMNNLAICVGWQR
jgi:hypothetical protein|nr:MAG TPA: hypothetical protein [Siphoviridae sp. ctTYz13]